MYLVVLVVARLLFDNRTPHAQQPMKNKSLVFADSPLNFKIYAKKRQLRFSGNLGGIEVTRKGSAISVASSVSWKDSDMLNALRGYEVVRDEIGEWVECVHFYWRVYIFAWYFVICILLYLLVSWIWVR